MTRKLRTFRIFQHPAYGYQAVKIGFSWPGLFFSGIWLLLKRLWGHALVFFSITIMFSLLETGFEKDQNIAGMVVILWLQIGIYIFVGVRGNEWHAANLQKRGFTLVDTVQAETPGAAISKSIRP